MLERGAYVLVLVLFAACDSRGGAPQSASPLPPSVPDVPSSPPRAPTPTEPTVRALAPAAAPASTATAAGSERAAAQLAQAMEVLNRTMRAMHEAAASAGGANACEHGYLSRVAADGARQRVLAQSPITAAAPRPQWVIAPLGRFLALCQTLPEPAQRCSGFARYQDDKPGCDRAVAALTPTQRSAWRALFHEQSPGPSP